MKTSKIFSAILVLILALSLFCFTACNDDNNDNPSGSVTVADEDYALTLKGMVNAEGETLDDVVITKKQIKKLFETKPAEFTSENPAIASDKTDDDGNPIPHTLKGVYLEDLMAEFSSSAPISEYGSLTLNATDGYVSIATEEVFNSLGHGSKMIVAFEYDGITLTEKEKSGALRAIFPSQIANVWAKKLNVIEFSIDILATPTVYSFSVLETLDTAAYGGNYDITEEDGALNLSGIKVSKLIGADNVLKGVSELDKMCIVGWDFDSATEKYSEYVGWTKYDVFNGGYLLTSGTKVGDPDWTLTRTPVFDGPDFNAGMTVKNVLSMSAFHSSVVCLETAMKRYDADIDGVTDGKFAIKDLLILLNMYDEDNSYNVNKVDGTNVSLTYAQITAAKVSKSDGKFVLTYDTNKTIEFAKLGIAI